MIAPFHLRPLNLRNDLPRPSLSVVRTILNVLNPYFKRIFRHTMFLTFFSIRLTEKQVRKKDLVLRGHIDRCLLP